MTYGATPLPGGGVQFRVWAPHVQTLAVKMDGAVFPMTREGEGFQVLAPHAQPGQTYALVLDDTAERPDPVSRSQPQGVHGPSEIIDPEAFAWSDQDWKGLALEEYIIYELHTGTFTPEGTFEGVLQKIPYLKDLGITAIELMPVAEFPGCRNWGYDGVDLFAPHSCYGGPAGLKKLVNACHAAGLAVVLDVVYNHVGPEGNYLGEFGPYYTDHYRTPWGPAINFDGPGSDSVRQFFIDNALFWLTEYHVDALRLDAIHGIYDLGARHVLAELADRFHQQAAELGRHAWLIAESDLNDVRVIQPSSEGGYGLDAQWNDEFHHALTSFLTKAHRGFLGGFGKLPDIQKALAEGFVYDGIYSHHRRRRFGTSSKDLAGSKFVVFIQNHDQIANTNQGIRLLELVSLDQHKLATTLLLSSPYLPLLFMGQEFAETAPFLYFTSHLDPALARMVTEGRRREYSEFALSESEEFCDPQAAATFEKSRITWPLVEEASHQAILGLYRDLIALRKRWRCLSNCRKDLMRVEIDEATQMLRMERSDPDGSRALLVCNFGPASAEQEPPAYSEMTFVPGANAILYLGHG
jgi:maltooligosyltrehalose trehalohydrolase